MMDVQKGRPTVAKTVDKVGVRNVPVLFPLKYANIVRKVACRVSIYTDLNKQSKGTHMSRLVQVCIKGTEKAGITGFMVVHDCLLVLKQRLEATDTYIKFTFPLLVKAYSPVTSNSGYLQLNCVAEGQLIGDERSYFFEIELPYMSLCPCSKAISDTGAAHNQRSSAFIRLQLVNAWVETPGSCKYDEDLIRLLRILRHLVSGAASSDVYPIVKRDDEKYIVDNAYEKPAFVEDVARVLAHSMDQSIREGTLKYFATAFVVWVNHYESIHQHDAVAVVRGGLL